MRARVASARVALATENLVEEERDLADALLRIVREHGKFDDDNTGVWAGYTPAEENENLAEIGVKCGNCVFFDAPNGCMVIQAEVEEGGLCRFAVLPDGAVNASGGASAPAEVLDWTKVQKPKTDVSLTADADYGDQCPPATQNIVLNIENRQNAIDAVGYGPLNPDEPNTEFWEDKAQRWKITPVEASKSICGNCVFFDRRSKTLDCIETGIAEGGSGDESAWGAIDQAELGYCTALDFKCAASRTCNAWAAGGPVTDESVQASGYTVGEDVNVDVDEFFNKPVYSLPRYLKVYVDKADPDDEYDVELNDLVPTQRTVNMRRVEDVVGSDKPIKVWINEDGEPEIVDGHHRSVARKAAGNTTVRAKVYKTPGLVATAGSKPAPKKDRIKGSKKNKPGSAKNKSGSVTISASVERSLAEKVKQHNEKAPDGRKATLRMLKAVYRRGAGAFSSSHRPDQNRASWAMARVNAFLKLLRSGRPKNPKYTTDNDLLPAKHPRATTASGTSMIQDKLRAAFSATVPSEPSDDEDEAMRATSVDQAVKALRKDQRERFTSKSQPRDNRGKFRKVLARLKQNLGEAGLQAVTEKVQDIENMDFAGNYVAANRAAGKLLNVVDRIDAGAIDSKGLEGVRMSARELGTVIANTPLPFGNDNATLKFSDLPPSMKTLADSMLNRVVEKLGPKDGSQAVAELKSYMSGADQLNQGEVQAMFSKLLRLLT